MHLKFKLGAKVAFVGVVVAAVVAPIAASAGHGTNACTPISPRRSGGISEMASCGTSGVSGDRAQFVRAITRPAENRPFLSQLAH
jgi:hypothetical protein